MKIGILGTGHIGKTLVRKLSAAGHDVKVANSRGPDTIEADVLASGGRAVTAEEAVVDVDVVILSIPLNRIPDIAPLIASVPAETVVIDTSNYYPHRDGQIDAIEGGQTQVAPLQPRHRAAIDAFLVTPAGRAMNDRLDALHAATERINEEALASIEPPIRRRFFSELCAVSGEHCPEDMREMSLR